MTKWVIIALIVFLILIILIPGIVLLRLYFRDIHQKQHAVLQNYPVLGRMRYILEKMGPELRQYLFLNNQEGKPFNRDQFEFVVKAGKYNSSILGFGAERNFTEDGFYISNSMFPALKDEMRIKQTPQIKTRTYEIDEENLFTRKEKSKDTTINPAFLLDEDNIVLGAHTARQPFYLKGLIGQSAMSYGSLGENAITALSEGLGIAGGTWMNTGEGSISPYHLKGDVDIIMQISPGLFGVRDRDGNFSWEAFRKQSETEQIKAFELKLAQGAKTKGGHVDGKKVTEEIARIRHVEPGQDIDSPNRFPGISSPEELLLFLDQVRDVGGKPVGIKIVAGDEQQVEYLVRKMAETGITPDFVTVDGSEGGTGASFYALAESVGLPAFSALPLVDDVLKRYGLRDDLKIIASGKLLTPDKVAIALCLGADLINIARGFMISTGCIMAQVCHTNTCPVGVATTDEHLQKGLVVEEKKYRVANYLAVLRQDLFDLAAVAGLNSPTKFNREHLVYRSAFQDHLQKQA